MPLGIPDDELPMQQREAEESTLADVRAWTRKRLAQVKAQVIKKGDRVRFAGAVYEVAEVEKFPHGPMIGIYDEPPSKHVDYLSPGSVTLVRTPTPTPTQGHE